MLKFKPKLFVWCDSPTVPTGFGNVAKNLLRDMYEDFDVQILAINFKGTERYDTSKWFLYPASSGNHDLLGLSRMKEILKREQPDIIFLFQDIFHIARALSIIEEISPQSKVVSYFPVDGKPFSMAWQEPLLKSDVAITYTDFGRNEVFKQFPELKNRIDLEILDHGIDLDTFTPLAEKHIRNFRKEQGWEKKFVAVNVNRFQPRKAIPLTLRAFGLFTKGYKVCECGNWYLKKAKTCDLNGCSSDKVVRTHPGRKDALLYLHMSPQEQSMGPGPANRLEAHALNAGFTDEDLGETLQINAADIYQNPLSEEEINLIYNGANVNVTTTLGEGFGFCVKPDTEILTEEGPKQIQNIEETKDKVLTGSGKFEKVQKKVTNKKDLLKFKIRGTVDLEVSKEHPFYGFKMGGRPLKYGKRNLEPEWIEAGNLEPRDLVGFPKPKLDKTLPEQIDLVNWVEGENIEYNDDKIWNKMGFSPKKENLSIQNIQNSTNETKKVVETARKHIKNDTVPKKESRTYKVYSYIKETDFEHLEPNKYNRFIDVNDDFLYLLGWFVAEGSSDGGSCVDFSLHRNESHIAKKLGKIGKKIFGADFTIRKRTTPKVCSLVFCSTILSQFFEKLCGKYSQNKFIHTMFFQSSNHISSLIKGYFEGDGHLPTDTNTFSCTTVSKKLAWQIRNILASQNIYSRIEFTNQRNAWKILIGGQDNNLFSDWIGIENYRGQSRKSPEFSIKTEDFIFVPIQEIEESTKNAVVYDIQVENTHSFVGNGILLHNSLAESMAAGTPSIAPDNSAIPEVLGDTGHLVSNIAHYSQAMDNAHVRPLVDVREFVEALEEEYQEWKSQSEDKQPNKKALQRAKTAFQWQDRRDKIRDIFLDLIDEGKYVK